MNTEFVRINNSGYEVFCSENFYGKKNEENGRNFIKDENTKERAQKVFI